jgi:hypothetical protein
MSPISYSSSHFRSERPNRTLRRIIKTSRTRSSTERSASPTDVLAASPPSESAMPSCGIADINGLVISDLFSGWAAVASGSSLGTARTLLPDDRLLAAGAKATSHPLEKRWAAVIGIAFRFASFVACPPTTTVGAGASRGRRQAAFLGAWRSSVAIDSLFEALPAGRDAKGGATPLESPSADGLHALPTESASACVREAILACERADVSSVSIPSLVSLCAVDVGAGSARRTPSSHAAASRIPSCYGR